MKNTHKNSVLQAVSFYVNKRDFSSTDRAILMEMIIQLLQEKKITLVQFIDAWDEKEAVFPSFRSKMLVETDALKPPFSSRP